MNRKMFSMLSVLLVLSMLLSACATAAEPTKEPEPTAVPFEALKYEAPNCDYGGLIKSIEAVDEFTVKFTMCAPDPAFPSKVAFSSLGIQPKEWLEKSVGTTDLLEKPVGTAAYYVAEWNRGDQIVFKRFADYWGEPAKSETLVFRWSSEAAQRLLELQAGTVDGIDNPGPDDFAVIQADANLKLYPREALNVFYIGMNNNYPPFDNEKVRQAVAMGINRQRIVDNFFPKGSEPASHFTPCAIPNGCAGESWYEFDAEAARALLAEAGFPDGFSTTLYYRDVVRGYLPQVSNVAQDIAAQLKEYLNIDAKIEVQESGTFISNSNSGLLDGFYLLGWGADYPDATNFLDSHFGTGASEQFGVKFSDITDALREAAKLSSDATRMPFYETANNAIKQHVPMVPVAHGGSGTAFKASVTGAHASPLGNESFAGMSNGTDSFVWMQNAEPSSMYCADETDGEALRACEQVMEPLLAYEVGGTAVKPALATACNANADLTVWTCTLRQGVKFHDGSSLDANDVVFTYVIQWDAAHPLHKGKTGAFDYWTYLFTAFLNAPPSE